MTDRYNGWTNFETWQAALWLSQANYHETDVEDLEFIVRELAGMDEARGLAADIFNGWISCVNFYEIAATNEE